jgi:hypothetical protein
VPLMKAETAGTHRIGKGIKVVHPLMAERNGRDRRELGADGTAVRVGR